MVLIATCPASTHAATPVVEGTEPARLYRTREEQREAGLKRHLTPWLTVSGLAEFEWMHQDFDTRDGVADDTGYDNSAALQLGLTAEPWDFFTAELILEYDTDNDRVVADEAIVALETGDWEIALGRQYLPFGVYFSNFVSGPLLEFGETRAREAAVLAWGPSDALEVALSVYRGRAQRRSGSSRELDWGLATEVWFNHAWSFGLSYQSDLADADERPLEDENDRYDKRVSGVSGYLLWAGEHFEATLEGLAATGSFRELDKDRNRPLAWNLELAWFVPQAPLEIAFRLEGSRELEDEPAYQFGTALTWRVNRQASLTVEYLRGDFTGQLATNDAEQAYETVDRLGALLSVAF